MDCRDPIEEVSIDRMHEIKQAVDFLGLELIVGFQFSRRLFVACRLPGNYKRCSKSVQSKDKAPAHFSGAR